MIPASADKQTNIDHGGAKTILGPTGARSVPAGKMVTVVSIIINMCTYFLTFNHGI